MAWAISGSEPRRPSRSCGPTPGAPRRASWAGLMVQFQNLDPFQHRVWPYLNVDATGIDHPEWNAAAAEVIRGLDEAIGQLCELAQRRGAAVMIVSDHGFGPCRGRIHVNRI